MAVNVNDKIRELSPAHRKKVETRAVELMTEAEKIKILEEAKRDAKKLREWFEAERAMMKETGRLYKDMLDRLKAIRANTVKIEALRPIRKGKSRPKKSGAKAVLELMVPIRIRRKGKIWIARCGALDVGSQGYTEAEAKKNLDEAIRLHLEACHEMGTLDDVLKGFRIEELRVTMRKTSTKEIG